MARFKPHGRMEEHSGVNISWSVASPVPRQPPPHGGHEKNYLGHRNLTNGLASG